MPIGNQIRIRRRIKNGVCDIGVTNCVWTKQEEITVTTLNVLGNYG